MVSSQHKMISKCAKFHWHSAYSSKVKGRTFLTFLPEIKYPTADNPNNIGLTFSQKNQLLEVGRNRILVYASRHIKLTKKLLKS